MANFILFWAKQSAVMGRMMEEGVVKSVEVDEDAATPPHSVPLPPPLSSPLPTQPRPPTLTPRGRMMEEGVVKSVEVDEDAATPPHSAPLPPPLSSPLPTQPRPPTLTPRGRMMEEGVVKSVEVDEDAATPPHSAPLPPPLSSPLPTQPRPPTLTPRGRMMEEGVVKSVEVDEDAATPPHSARLLKSRVTCPKYADAHKQSGVQCYSSLDEDTGLTELRTRLQETRKLSMSPTHTAEAGQRLEPQAVEEMPAGPPPSPSPHQSPPRPLLITPVQINLIRKSWANAKTRGKVEPIANIFHHAMFKCPEMRVLLEQGGSTGAKDHVLLFLDLFESLMENLEETSGISGQLRDIGKEHVRLWDLGFRASHFDILIQSLLDATLKWGEKPVRTADCQTAWAEVCSFIVEELKEGFHQARKFSKRKPSLKSF